MTNQKPPGNYGHLKSVIARLEEKHGVTISLQEITHIRSASYYREHRAKDVTVYVYKDGYKDWQKSFTSAYGELADRHLETALADWSIAAPEMLAE